MKLLLDTHCLIWALVDAPELSSAARKAMARAEEVAFSEACR
jgi:PIN domain nuclease of toxin-antitoxin system